MAGNSPSAKNLVWTVGRGGIDVGLDPDVQHLGPRHFAPYHTVHMPYEPLTTPRIAVDGDGIRYPIAEELQPRLAVSWTPSADFRTWTIGLRQGVKSHAGNELTAEDVKWSWDRVYALKGVGLWRSRRLAGVQSSDDVQVVDRYTVRFNLSAPNPEFPQYFVFATSNVVDSTEVKKHATANDPWATEFLERKVAGFGAFNLAEQTSDILRFTARDDFWAGRPGIDSVTQVGVDSRAEGLAMLLKGDANMALNLYPEEMKVFEGRPEFTVSRVRANHSTLEFNWREAPFDDQNVRQAICYALPYQRILDQVYMGTSRLSKSPLMTVTKFYTPEFWQYNTNIEKARELLKASGHPDGFATELYIGPSNESLRFGEIVREVLKPLGIEVEVRHWTTLKFNTKVPMWFKEECGHALYEPMYDLGHDYDPPIGMWGGRNIRDKPWTDRIKEIRNAEAGDQARLYRDIQRDIIEAAPCAHIAEIDSGWVFRGDIDPWALGPLFLGANTTVWSAHRQILPWW